MSSARTLRLRPDLVMSRRAAGDRAACVVKDPAASRFFRLGEVEHFIARQLDGTASLEAIRKMAEKEFGAALPAEMLEAFVERLGRLGLLDGAGSGFGRTEGRERRLRGSLLYMRFKALDPCRSFERLARLLWICFTPPFLVTSLAVLCAGAAVAAANAVEIGQDLFHLQHVQALVLAWITMFATITAHELAHGLTCTHFGGKVHELGFMLIYFQPAFYCNVSDAWLFPGKARRLWVTFAGAYLDLVLLAVSALAWRVTERGTTVSDLTLVVLLTVGIRTVFNLNPLIKLDGYYLLSDLLDIPNLRSRAMAYLAERLRFFHPRRRADFRTTSPREALVYLAYGILAWTYSAWLLWVVGNYVGGALTRRYQGWGFVVFASLLAVVFRRPLAGSVRAMGDAARRSRSGLLALVRVATLLALLASLAALLYYVRMDLRVAGEFRILPSHNADVRAEVEGIVEGIDVTEGAAVRRGDRIARISDRDYRAELARLKAEMAENDAHLRLLRAGARVEEVQLATTTVEKAEERLHYARSQLERLTRLYAEQLTSKRELDQTEEDVSVKNKELQEARGKLQVLLAGSRPEEIEAREAELTRLKSERQYLLQELRFVNVVSPIDGVVTTPKLDEMVGRHVQKGDLIARVHELNRVTAEIAVPERDFSDVRVGERVVLRTRAFPDRSFEGTVASIASTAQEPRPGEVGRTILVTTHLENAALLLKPEMTGNAKISCGERRLFELVTRRIARYIRVEFWSWW